MTTSVANPIRDVAPPFPDFLRSRDGKMVLGYALTAGVLAVLGFIFTMFMRALSAQGAGWTEWQSYAVTVPMLASVVACLLLAIVLLTVRRDWAMIACAAAGAALAATCYFTSTLFLGQNPLAIIQQIFSLHLPMHAFFDFPLEFIDDIVSLPGIAVAGAGVFVLPALMVLTLPQFLGKLRRLPPPDLDAAPHFRRVGTLRYTAFGLVVLFVWLLWGDFVYTLFDTNMPNILVLKLKDMGASDTLNSVLNKTLGYLVAFLFAPAISFRSDRTRSRHGRRIPYLTWSTPFVGVFLVLIGYYDSLTGLLTGGADHVKFLGVNLSATTMALLVFAILFVMYDFANNFVGTVYWYLFNDVVPERLLSQFLSFFRIVGTLAGMIYSKFIFPHALEHFRVMFVLAGIVYVGGFMLMCYMVREGSYPPPPPLLVQGRNWREVWTSLWSLLGRKIASWRAMTPIRRQLLASAVVLLIPVCLAMGILLGVLYFLGYGVEYLFRGLIGRGLRAVRKPPGPPRGFESAVSSFFAKLTAQMITFVEECFTHRFYWYFFLQSTFFFVSWQSGTFATLRNRDSLGLTLQQMGDLGAITGFVSLLMQWPAGWLSDKWNPIRVFMWTTFITFGANILQCIWLFWDFKPNTTLALMALFSFTLMPFGALHGAAELPMYMRLLPKERYGQFCSANAMIRSFALILGSVGAGLFLDGLETFFHMGDYRYRFYPVWVIFFQIFALLFLWLLYKEWKARGADKGYTPPEA